MSKKNFDDIGANPVYGAAFESMDKASTTKRKYTKKAPADAQEAAERAREMRTQGREGCKLPRMSMAFSPENYEYVRVMAGVTGQSMTHFINEVLALHREAHPQTYEQAKAIKNSL